MAKDRVKPKKDEMKDKVKKVSFKKGRKLATVKASAARPFKTESASSPKKHLPKKNKTWSFDPEEMKFRMPPYCGTKKVPGFDLTDPDVIEDWKQLLRKAPQSLVVYRLTDSICSSLKLNARQAHWFVFLFRRVLLGETGFSRSDLASQIYADSLVCGGISSKPSKGSAYLKTLRNWVVKSVYPVFFKLKRCLFPVALLFLYSNTLIKGKLGRRWKRRVDRRGKFSVQVCEKTMQILAIRGPKGEALQEPLDLSWWRQNLYAGDFASHDQASFNLEFEDEDGQDFAFAAEDYQDSYLNTVAASKDRKSGSRGSSKKTRSRELVDSENESLTGLSVNDIDPSIEHSDKDSIASSYRENSVVDISSDAEAESEYEDTAEEDCARYESGLEEDEERGDVQQVLDAMAEENRRRHNVKSVAIDSKPSKSRDDEGIRAVKRLKMDLERSDNEKMPEFDFQQIGEDAIEALGRKELKQRKKAGGVHSGAVISLGDSPFKVDQSIRPHLTPKIPKKLTEAPMSKPLLPEDSQLVKSSAVEVKKKKRSVEFDEDESYFVECRNKYDRVILKLRDKLATVRRYEEIFDTYEGHPIVEKTGLSIPPALADPLLFHMDLLIDRHRASSQSVQKPSTSKSASNGHRVKKP